MSDLCDYFYFEFQKKKKTLKSLTLKLKYLVLSTHEFKILLKNCPYIFSEYLNQYGK